LSEFRQTNEEYYREVEKKRLAIDRIDDPVKRIKAEGEFRKWIMQNCPKEIKEGWKQGIYCDKCKKVVKTSSWLKLWLWSIYHMLKCFHLHGLSPNSFLRINREHETIVEGKVVWVD
jgi:hypothetical protein